MSYPLQLPLMLKPPPCYHPARSELGLELEIGEWEAYWSCDPNVVFDFREAILEQRT